MVQPNNQPPASGKLLFRVHRGGAELRPTAPDEIGDLPEIEEGLTFATAQLHGEDLRVTVGATVTLNGTPVNREYDITDDGLLSDIRELPWRRCRTTPASMSDDRSRPTPTRSISSTRPRRCRRHSK
jgi:hypothetical protein